MTNDELYLIAHQLVQTVTGLPGKQIIKATQNSDGASPPGEYAAINTDLGASQHGQAKVELSNTGLVSSPIGSVNDVNHSIKAQLVKPVTINFFRSNAHEYAAMLPQVNKRPDISQLLFDSGLGWRDLEGPRDLTALQSSRWEPRSQVTINFWMHREQSATTNAIYSADIQAENEDGDTLQSNTTNTQ